MGAKELLEECRRRCLDVTGCTEREDLLRVLRDGRGPSSAAGSASRDSQASSARASGRMPGRDSRFKEPAATTVWDRQRMPPHLVSRRSQALYLLGLDGTPGLISAAELRAAYRKAAMESHPDKLQNHSRQGEAKDLFQKVKDAFDFLNSSGFVR